jgi:hypothetical protein
MPQDTNSIEAVSVGITTGIVFIVAGYALWSRWKQEKRGETVPETGPTNRPTKGASTSIQTATKTRLNRGAPGRDETTTAMQTTRRRRGAACVEAGTKEEVKQEANGHIRTVLSKLLPKTKIEDLEAGLSTQSVG